MKLNPDNLSYPARILIGSSSGTGFFIRKGDDIYLITAKHVLFNEDALTKEMRLYDNTAKVLYHSYSEPNIYKPGRYVINLTLSQTYNNLKIHPSADLVVIKVGVRKDNKLITADDVINELPTDGKVILYDISTSRKFDEVEISNDVFILGYPVSLSSKQLNQLNYDSPLVRKGIIAGKNNDNQTIILDCPVYGGNSGGMVLEIRQESINEFKFSLIGIIVQFIPFIDQWTNIRFPQLSNSSFQNSGYSVVLPVNLIFDLIDEIETVS